MLRLLLKAPGCTPASELAQLAAKRGNAEALAFLLSGEVGVRVTPSLLLSAVGALRADVTRAALAAAHAQRGSAAAADCGSGSGGGGDEAVDLLAPVALNALMGYAIRCASELGWASDTPDALATMKLLVEVGANPRANVRVLMVEEGKRQEAPTLALNLTEPRGALWGLLGSRHAHGEILLYLLDASRCSPDGKLEPLVGAAAGAGAAAGEGAAELPSLTDTPLSRAIAQSQWHAAQLLLARGANVGLIASGQAEKLKAGLPSSKKRARSSLCDVISKLWR